VRVGIPKGLLYSRYGAAWESLLTSLGHEVVLSPPSNRAIVDSGCKLAVDETCLSVKVYLGQVAWLAKRADKVLVPRFVSVHRKERECVKLWGIHDIARNSLPDADIIGYSVDAYGLTHKRVRPTRGLYDFAISLGASPLKAATATAKALLAQAAVRREERREHRRSLAENPDGPRVLVVGHGYNLHDDMIGSPIVKTLRELGCQVRDSEAAPERIARRLARKASPGLQWTNNLQLLGSVHHWYKEVDGIVFIVTFPCGPDSLVTELAVRTIPGVPMITLVLDEHSGEGGLRTRLESFVDIVSMQRAAKRSKQANPAPGPQPPSAAAPGEAKCMSPATGESGQ
jgi:predicted nucleotide-binding protein (sugar kinase/HSP70/actin superfamily)